MALDLVRGEAVDEGIVQSAGKARRPGAFGTVMAASKEVVPHQRIIDHSLKDDAHVARLSQVVQASWCSCKA